MFQFRLFKLFPFLMLILSVTAGIQTSDFTVGVGDEATLSCKDVKDFQDNCNSITWLYAHSGQSLPLFESGKIHKHAGDKSQRLSVTVDCLLVLKDVKVEDAGFYTCRQFDKSGKQLTDSGVQLSVTTKNEATLTTTTSTSPAPEDDANTATTIIVAVVAVTVTALLITAVVVVRLKRTKDKKRQIGDNIGPSENPAETNTAPESSQEKVDPEEGVSYATINFNNTSSGAQVHGGNLQHDMVTYSTVRAHSSPAGASDDPNSLYSVI